MPAHYVFGVHPVEEVLHAGRRKISTIRYLKGTERRIGKLLSIAEGRKISLLPVNKQELERLSDGGNHQGVLAEVGSPIMLDIEDFITRMAAREGNQMAVALDSIQDTGNFGAILRSAELFGITGIIYPKDRSADINSTVVKTSAGASEYLDYCRVTNLARTLNRLADEGWMVIAADGDGECRLPDIEPRFPLVIVMGSEEKGVRPLVKKQCEVVVRVPVAGKLDSLNVSAAASVIFYEVARKGSII